MLVPAPAPTRTVASVAARHASPAVFQHRPPTREDTIPAWRPFPLMEPLLNATPLLAGCTHIYLDFGSNDGHKLHELYTPARFPQNQHVYTEVLGNGPRADVCALGFEPFPNSSRMLRRLVLRLGSAAPRLLTFPAAISHSNGIATLHDDGAEWAHHWGASLLPWSRDMPSLPMFDVPIVDLRWLLERHVPKGAKVLAKMDVEGAEYDTLPPAIDALCDRVDVLLLERHDRFFSAQWHGHRQGFDSRGRIEKLDAALRQMSTRRAKGDCRTEVRSLSMYEIREKEVEEPAGDASPPPPTTSPTPLMQSDKKQPPNALVAPDHMLK